MPATISTESEAHVRFLDELFGTTPLRNVSFKFWDGTSWPDERPRAATFALKHPAALREMFESGTELGLAEAFLHDDFDIEGDIESAFELADALEHRPGDNWLASLRSYFHLRHLSARHGRVESERAFLESGRGKHSPPRDRRAVSHHYDVSNDFFALWLDRRMLYSCAYFERPGLTIDAAQEAKLQHICRKLRLHAGQHLLDIGCGWGGLAIFAAQHYGVRVTGITLSQRQLEFAATRVRASGLTDLVSIHLSDYRELAVVEPFDAIVSVGMSEHVGSAQLDGYFKTAARMLKPGGVFLNHAIGEGVRPRARVGPSFIEKYVFPDSDIPPIPRVVQAAEAAGLEVRDVENLREHYTLTLRQWVRRLEEQREQALCFVDEETYRIWRLYMAGSARGFSRGHLAVYQALLAKPDDAGNSHLPPTRRDWYAEPESSGA
jgi:cyclopropane-fatty-acyl-phospholipid synthase